MLPTVFFLDFNTPCYDLLVPHSQILFKKPLYYSLKNAGLDLIFFLDSNSPFGDLLYPLSHKPRKNTFVLVGADRPKDSEMHRTCAQYQKKAPSLNAFPDRIFLFSLQVQHRQANHWCIVNLLCLDVLSAIHQKVSQAWNIRCNVYKYILYFLQVFHDLCPLPCCFCAGVLHLVEQTAGERNLFHTNGSTDAETTCSL